MTGGTTISGNAQLAYLVVKSAPNGNWNRENEGNPLENHVMVNIQDTKEESRAVLERTGMLKSAQGPAGDDANLRSIDFLSNKQRTSKEIHLYGSSFIFSSKRNPRIHKDFSSYQIVFMKCFFWTQKKSKDK